MLQENVSDQVLFVALAKLEKITLAMNISDEKTQVESNNCEFAATKSPYLNLSFYTSNNASPA